MGTRNAGWLTVLICLTCAGAASWAQPQAARRKTAGGTGVDEEVPSVSALRVSPAGDMGVIAMRGPAGKPRRYSLSLINLDSGDVVRHYNGDSFGIFGEWSPDGRSFATTRRNKRGRRRAGVLDVTTGRWRALRVESPLEFIYWPPDGGSVVVESIGVRAPWDMLQVHHVPMVGGPSTLVANGSLRYIRSPFVDGALVFRRVAVADDWGTSNRYYALREIGRQYDTLAPMPLGATTGDQRLQQWQQSELLAGYHVERIRGSRSGDALAVTCSPRYAAGGTALRVVDDLDTPNGRELCAGEFRVGDWAPDGKRLIGVENPSANGDGQLCVIDVLTGEVTLLAGASGVRIVGRNPQWGKDGQAVIYMRQVDRGMAVFRYDLASRVSRQVFPQVSL